VSSAREDWLRLGVLTAPWGTHGEVKVRPDVEPAYLERVARVYLGPEHRPIDLLGVARRGRAYTLKLRGIDTMTAAETLRGVDIVIPRSEAPPLAEGEFFVADVVGLRAVTTTGRALGTVVEVLSTGANDVYVVRGDAGEVLIPAIHDVVTSIDPAAGMLQVAPMPGLLSDDEPCALTS
jgi:16S rRNA processing protein RimM